MENLKLNEKEIAGIRQRMQSVEIAQTMLQTFVSALGTARGLEGGYRINRDITAFEEVPTVLDPPSGGPT